MLAEQIKIDYIDNVTYIGISASGTKETSPLWRISKITHDSLGKVLSIQYSGGSVKQIYAWSDRLGVDYK